MFDGIAEAILIIGLVIGLLLGGIGYLIGSNTEHRECVKYSESNGECVEYKVGTHII